MILLKNKKMILMFNKKVASSSVADLGHTLVNYNALNYNSHFDWEDDKYSDFKKVLIVRNPYSRLLSSYNDDIGYNVIYKYITLDFEDKNKKRSEIKKRIMRIKAMTNKEKLEFQNKRRLNRQKRFITFEDFIIKICNIPDEKSDPHFISQTDIYNKIIPDVIIKLEDMIGWDELGLPKFPHSHKSKKILVTEIPEHLKKMIQERFKNDFELLNYDL